jgi:YidC/Oxa1 family membrane protein insertase
MLELFNNIITYPMMNALLFIYQVLFHNFGLAIIAFTILVRVLLYPLSAKQVQSTKAMQEFQNSKEWQDIQKKHKGDRETLAREQMRLYKEMGISPFASCLPTLLTFPILFGLFPAISSVLAFTPSQLLHLTQHVYPFINVAELLPMNPRFLWMDMNQPERLMIAGVGIPVLTIIVVITTYLQSKLMQPTSTNPSDQSAQMTKSMNLMMPLMMGWFALQYSAGIALYLIFTNVTMIAQYALMGQLHWSNLLPQAKDKQQAQKSSQSKPAAKKPSTKGDSAPKQGQRSK